MRSAHPGGEQVVEYAWWFLCCLHFRFFPLARGRAVCLSTAIECADQIDGCTYVASIPLEG